jgi:hypothetical protein
LSCNVGKRAFSGDASPAVKKGDGGYADWVIVVTHGLREYFDFPYRRSVVEAVFFALKQRYGDTLRARTLFGQFQEVVLKSDCQRY